MGFAGWPLSPNLVPHTTSSRFPPMDPRSKGVADLSSRLGCATLAGMAKQAPLPKQRHYRNPAKKSSGASSQVPDRREYGL